MNKQELIAKWEKVSAEKNWVYGGHIAYQQGYQHAAREFLADLLALNESHKSKEGT